MQKSSAIQYYLFETSLHQKVADFSGILKKVEMSFLPVHNDYLWDIIYIVSLFEEEKKK